MHDLDYFDQWFGPYFGFDHTELVIGHTSEPHARWHALWSLVARPRRRSPVLLRHPRLRSLRPVGITGRTTRLDLGRANARWPLSIARPKLRNRFSIGLVFRTHTTPTSFPNRGPRSMIRLTCRLGTVAGVYPPKPDFYATLAAGDFYGDDPELQDKVWGDAKVRPELLRRRYSKSPGRLLRHGESDGPTDWPYSRPPRSRRHYRRHPHRIHLRSRRLPRRPWFLGQRTTDLRRHATRAIYRSSPGLQKSGRDQSCLAVTRRCPGPRC